MTAGGDGDSQTPSERSFAITPSTNSLGLLNTISPTIGGGQSSITINPPPTVALYQSSEIINPGNSSEQNLESVVQARRRPSLARFAPTPPIDENPPLEGISCDRICSHHFSYRTSIGRIGSSTSPLQQSKLAEPYLHLYNLIN